MGAPASLVAQMVNNLPANAEGSGSILGLEKSPRERHVWTSVCSAILQGVRGVTKGFFSFHVAVYLFLLHSPNTISFAFVLFFLTHL